MALNITIESTPNPDAKKFTVDRALTKGHARSYLSAEAASEDPIARELFAIKHVVGVLIVNDFCTVNKAPAGRWATLTPKIKQVLNRTIDAATPQPSARTTD